MADDQKFSFAKLNFFSRLDARARVFVLFGGLIGIIFLVYIGTKLLSGPTKTTGPSRVASAPQGLKLVPGGTQSAEYNRMVEQANLQRAKEAQVTGASAVPTLMGVQQPMQMGNQCVICTEQEANVKNFLDAWVKQGKVTPEVVKTLTDLAAQNVPVAAYADQLNELVKAGKLTPEQARLLLEQYQKQHVNALANDSARSMDALIKSGGLPLDAANELLQSQKNKMSPNDYAALLQRLAKEGKISPQVAQQLLAQYTQQRAKEIILQSITVLHQMARNGEITPDVEKELIDLENRMVALDVVSTTLQRYISNGKIAPVVAKKIEDEYKQQKADIGSAGTMDGMLKDAEAAAYQEINELLQAGKITPDTATLLTNLIQKRVSMDEFTSAVNTLAQQKKLPAEVVSLKIADYRKVLGVLAAQQSLGNLQANNASSADYANELKRLVHSARYHPMKRHD